MDSLLIRESQYFEPSSQPSKEFDLKLFKWLAEIIYKKKKTLATFDRTISLYLRASGNISINQQNCQQVLLACFDIVQRFIEVRYVSSEEILKWINTDGIKMEFSMKTFNDLQQLIYKRVAF